MHPGHTTKHINGETVQFVKGSPLWDRKPDVQLWYDTTRDWIRMYCPQAVLGVYTPEEVADPEFRDVTPRPTLGERLAVSARPDLREGFRPTEVSTSLEQASGADDVGDEMAEAPIHHEYTLEDIREAVDAAKKVRKKPRKRPGKPTSASKPKPKAKPPATAKPRQRPAPPQRAAAQPEAGLEEAAAAYVAQAKAWIAEATDPNVAAERWDAEYDDRNTAEVPVEDRNRLLALLDERYEQLRKQQE